MRPPPEGQESNFIDPVSRAYQLEIVIAIAVALVLVFLSSRLYCRLKVTKTFGADDCECGIWNSGEPILLSWVSIEMLTSLGLCVAATV